MTEIRVVPVKTHFNRGFLSRVFEEMCETALPDGEFPVGRSLSWRAFRLMATDRDLARVCTTALDRREPAVRPDRYLFASFQMSLGIHLLQSDLPFTRPQLAVLRDSADMMRRVGHQCYPVEMIEDLLERRALHG